MSGNPITNQPGSGVTTINFANCKKVFVQRDYSEVSYKNDLLISTYTYDSSLFPNSCTLNWSYASPSDCPDSLRYVLKYKCIKLFSLQGCGVRFQTNFPAELEGRIERQQFEFTLNMMNNMYAEAEKANCSTFCEGCMACLTAYVIYFCSETHYEKCLRKVARFVVEQNEQVRHFKNMSQMPINIKVLN